MQEIEIQTIRQKMKRLLPKLKCAFHQNEALTNFCSCEKCLLPLCPTCIKIHTIQHVSMKTDPSYQSLYDMVVNLNVDIRQFIFLNQQNHRLITQTEQKLHQFKQKIFVNIDNLKRSITDEIDRYFTQLIITTEQKIQQIPYISQLAKHKAELKKTILSLKKFEKQLNDQTVTGKFVVRNLIKYSANNINDMLEKYDTQCKEFVSKVNGNFCQFQLKENLKNDIVSFLVQAVRIKIQEIPTLQSKVSQQMLGVSQKLQQFTLQGKGSQKCQMKNTLTKVMSKLSHPTNQSSNSNKTLNTSSQAITINNDPKRQERKDSKHQRDVSQLSKKIFQSNNRRSFTNHSSQRKSLHISCDNETSIVEVRDKENRNLPTEGVFQERRSMSKGKGISLIQPRNSMMGSGCRSLTTTQQIRFSLSQIENINFDNDSKSSFQFISQNSR